MTGDRDSEIGVIITDTEKVKSTMNGKTFYVRKFAHELRMNLWREHLGLPHDDNSIKDPVIESVYKGIWLQYVKIILLLSDNTFSQNRYRKYSTFQ